MTMLPLHWLTEPGTVGPDGRTTAVWAVLALCWGCSSSGVQENTNDTSPYEALESTFIEENGLAVIIEASTSCEDIPESLVIESEIHDGILLRTTVNIWDTVTGDRMEEHEPSLSYDLVMELYANQPEFQNARSTVFGCDDLSSLTFALRAYSKTGTEVLDDGGLVATEVLSDCLAWGHARQTVNDGTIQLEGVTASSELLGCRESR